ncbi:hypothetical protein M23134_08398 [Microscilla marina ATCC 23134]|uniref:Uncharacterized protein n=1 Tax=Microscilla marina ATCC 23134 TaxID=313606 RepID=A1ZR35_MICM2|nr:hypothetical protein M23134_08398 [Microscilla marina ATCC 23134]
MIYGTLISVAFFNNGQDKLIVEKILIHQGNTCQHPLCYTLK